MALWREEMNEVSGGNISLDYNSTAKKKLFS